ncbi:MAG: 50S ribosomal protein L23 [Candidatus Sumerlaeaceae bacterium]
MKSPYQILQRPLITERATLLAENKEGPQYVFRVSKTANKIEIRKAIESVFNVQVDNVNTVVVKGKKRRQGRNVGKTSDWKKAFVTLKEGQTIDVL